MGGNISEMKRSDHRVFFQNAEGNINMGVLFNDPDVDYDDIYWYFILAGEMHEAIGRSFKFILRLFLFLGKV